MSCPHCDPELNIQTQPKGRYSVHFGHGNLQVTKDGQTINDCYQVQVPDRAWRFRSPVEICRHCGVSLESYIDTSGSFAVVEGEN